MKRIRLLIGLALLGTAACSSPTEPRLPTPEPGPDEDPDDPSVTVAFEEFSIGVSFTNV